MVSINRNRTGQVENEALCQNFRNSSLTLHNKQVINDFSIRLIHIVHFITKFQSADQRKSKTNQENKEQVNKDRKANLRAP